MRYLKKFENSSEEDIREKMIEYIDECFIELIFGEDDTYEDEDEFILTIDVNYLHEDDDVNNITKVIDLFDRVTKKLILVENCIEKVKLEYPDIEYLVDVVQQDNNSDAVVFDNIIKITFTF